MEQGKARRGLAECLVRWGWPGNAVRRGLCGLRRTRRNAGQGQGGGGGGGARGLSIARGLGGKAPEGRKRRCGALRVRGASLRGGGGREARSIAMVSLRGGDATKSGNRRRWRGWWWRRSRAPGAGGGNTGIGEARVAQWLNAAQGARGQARGGGGRAGTRRPSRIGTPPSR